MGFFEKIREGIKKTKDSMMQKVERVINSFTKIDEDFLEELEETLIMSDVGVETSEAIIEELRKKIKETGATDTGVVRELLEQIISDMLREERPFQINTRPSIIFVIGVNGAGKTTTVGKLAAGYKAQGKKVLVAAADTFRAAAIDQLQVWTDRAGVDIVKHKEGADPAAVVYSTAGTGCDNRTERGQSGGIVQRGCQYHRHHPDQAGWYRKGWYRYLTEKSAGTAGTFCRRWRKGGRLTGICAGRFCPRIV